MSIYRSFLFAPGNHPRRVEKALLLDVDAVILDLEDACPLAEKKATRPIVVAACQRPRKGLGYVRVDAAFEPRISLPTAHGTPMLDITMRCAEISVG